MKKKKINHLIFFKRPFRIISLSAKYGPQIEDKTMLGSVLYFLS